MTVTVGASAQLSHLACAVCTETSRPQAARQTPHWDRDTRGRGLPENCAGASEPGGPTPSRQRLVGKVGQQPGDRELNGRAP